MSDLYQVIVTHIEPQATAIYTKHISAYSDEAATNEAVVIALWFKTLMLDSRHVEHKTSWGITKVELDDEGGDPTRIEVRHKYSDNDE